MTSYEQPDASLLVEHLLPSLLGLNNSLSQEFQERNLFFSELGTTLETMRGRLTVISSPPREERKNSAYPWLWRYVNHLNVGSEAPAVQHAKLWAFHWKVGDEEILELHVSSTNLTTAAFKDQLQAGWQVMLPLGAQDSRSTQRTWGKLIPFLQSLRDSAGDNARTPLERLITLLGRVKCPEGLTFVTSIPGKDKKGAARQLADFKPEAIHVLTPTIGEWNLQTLKAWSAEVGKTVPCNIHLKWISESHPWAKPEQWTLSTNAYETLEAGSVKVECLPDGARFSKEHRDGDKRWSHAKLYLMRCRYNKRKLLLTSANWSASAWGAGKIGPRNFELGVVFDTDWTDLEKLVEPFGPPDTVPFCVERAKVEEGESALEWAEGSWDGKRIELCVRSVDSVTPISAVVTFMGGREECFSLVKGKASISWSDSERPPITARFTQGDEVLEVDILDLRPPTEFAKTPLPEVDPKVEQALREAFLLQRYGGPVVDPESVPGLGVERRRAASTATPGEYDVKEWTETRAAFCVIDKWRATLDNAADDAQRREQIRMDGEQLCALFARRDGPGAALVAEELGWHLKD